MAESASSSAGDWSEHTTPDGTKYYHNAKTGVSTWEKPEELKTKTEATCPWTEYTTGNGRKYYFNSQTQKSTWEMPPEFKAMKEALEAKASQETKPVETSTPSPRAETAAAKPTAAVATPKSSTAPAKSSAARQASSTSKDPAADAFKSLLRDSNILPGTTWDSTMRTIINDRRYQALRTLAERKATFREYIEEYKIRDREERRAREEALRNNFMAMLREGNIDERSTYRKAMTLFDRDPRWKAVEREKDREDLFDDYIWDLETKKEEEERNNREANIKAYNQLFDEYGLSVTTQWRKFKEDAKDDVRFTSLDKLDRLALFQHRIRDLERIEAEDKRKARETLRRRSRINRDIYRELLQQSYHTGKLDRNTRWKRFKRTLKDNPIYEDMIGQPGSTPSELFGDFVEDLQERYDTTKRIVDRIMKEGNITITPWMTEEQFLAAISTHPSYSNIDQKAAAELFLEMREQVDKKEKKEKRRREKNFRLMLKSYKNQLTQGSVFDDKIRSMLAEEASFKAVQGDEERKELFEKYINDLKNRSDDYESSSEEEGMVESESDEERKDRKRRHRDKKEKSDRKRRRHSSKDRDDDKHKKKRKSDKDKKHKRRDDDRKKRRREEAEEGEVISDHRGEVDDDQREEGEMRE